MNIIVSVDKNWNIGKSNKLLVSIPTDIQYFYQKVSGKIIIMGRKTLQSLPNSKPISGCLNIILTRNKNYNVNDAYVVYNLVELFEKIKKYDSKDIYVIGGSNVYKQLLPYCDTAYITKIDYVYDADCNFPNLDELENWKVVSCSDEYTYFDLEYKFLKYHNYLNIK